MYCFTSALMWLECLFHVKCFKSFLPNIFISFYSGHHTTIRERSAKVRGFIIHSQNQQIFLYFSSFGRAYRSGFLSNILRLYHPAKLIEASERRKMISVLSLAQYEDVTSQYLHSPSWHDDFQTQHDDVASQCLHFHSWHPDSSFQHPHFQTQHEDVATQYEEVTS